LTSEYNVVEDPRCGFDVFLVKIIIKIVMIKMNSIDQYKIFSRK